MSLKVIKKAKIKDLTREEWLELRRESIGGSDASIILGLSPYKSKLELYCDKKGIVPLDAEVTSEAMRLGNDLEDYVAKRFCEATGKKVQRSGYMYQHPLHLFMTANVDRLIVGENAGLECKTTSVHNKSDFDNGEIPLTYYSQCMHYMAVMGFDRMYLAVLVLGKGFYHYTIERNSDEINALIHAETEFWSKHIVPSVPPLADGSEGSLAALDILHPERGGEVICEECTDDLTRYLEIGRLEKKLKGEKEEIKGRLVTSLGDAERGVSSAGNFTYLAQTSSKVDKKLLIDKYPEIAKEVIVENTSRVLRVKEIKR